LGEIVLRHATTAEAVDAFTERYPAHAMGVAVYGDSSGNNSKTSGTSDYQIVRDGLRHKGITGANYKLQPANPSVKERIAVMNGRLKSAAGNVSMLVDPGCKELIQDFEQVSYKADSNQVDKDRDRMRTHASDALGYMLWQECVGSPKIGDRQERIL
jgi:hypothetical protein